MESKLFQDAKEGAERIAMLDANCKKTIEAPVKRYYTADELQQMQKEFAEDRVILMRKEEELRKHNAEAKAEMKPIYERSGYVLAQIRAGFVETNQPVFLFDDQEEGMMHTFDQNGELIESRKLRPEEKQTNVISMAHRTGTNN